MLNIIGRLQESQDPLDIESEVTAEGHEVEDKPAAVHQVHQTV